MLLQLRLIEALVQLEPLLLRRIDLISAHLISVHLL
jgi:hypothetical protein